MGGSNVTSDPLTSWPIARKRPARAPIPVPATPMQWMRTSTPLLSLFGSPDHVKAERALDDGAHLPDVERERRVGEGADHLVAREAAEIAVTCGPARFVGVSRHDLVEVLPLFDEVERLVRSRACLVLAARDAARRGLRTLVHDEQVLGDDRIRPIVGTRCSGTRSTRGGRFGGRGGQRRFGGTRIAP